MLDETLGKAEIGHKGIKKGHEAKNVHSPSNING